MSKNVNWLVDTYILESPSTYGDLLKSITDSGANLHLTKYVPFAEEQDYGDFTNKDCVILYGTFGYIKKCNKGFIPGAYGVTPNMNCILYYANIERDWLLNADYFVFPFYEIKTNYKRIFETVDDDKFFMRPLSGDKTFAGQVLKRNDIDFELNSTQQLTSVMPNTLCLVSKVKEIKSEYRFIIVNHEVVSGSEYRWDDSLYISDKIDNDCLRLAKEMSRHHWQPDVVYTCDVAMTSDGPFIIELNSFSCAGLYACNHDLVVKRVNEVALMEFEGKLDF